MCVAVDSPIPDGVLASIKDEARLTDARSVVLDG